MTIDELIERLEEYRDDLGGDVDVLLMSQKNWPFENHITGLASRDEMNDFDDGEEEDEHDLEDNAVFIVEAEQRCYGSKRAWEVAY